MVVGEIRTYYQGDPKNNNARDFELVGVSSKSDDDCNGEKRRNFYLNPNWVFKR